MGEIVPGVHYIDGLKGGRVSAQVYLLVDGDILALIDAGLPGNIRAITQFVESIGRRMDQLRYILLTHCHPDHTGGAPALQERSGATILAHPNDVQASGSQASVAYMGVFGSSPLPLPFLRRVPADGLLEDDDTLPLLGGLRVVHTPGHTPGSICFYLEESGVLFTGDTILESHGVLGKNRHAFPGSHLRDYQASLERLASLRFDTLCPGHGEPVVGSADARVRTLVDAGMSYGLSWRLFERGGRVS